MAKGQKRSNREVRKPKTAPAKTKKSAAPAKEFLKPLTKKK